MQTDIVMDDGDGKSPEENLAHEEALLTHKLRLLEDFTRKGLVPASILSLMEG
jgi:hypothetical protein